MLIITTEARGNPGALCRVVKETPQRLYVEVIESDRWRSAISGSSGNCYVDKSNVLARDVTEAQYDAYRARYAQWWAADRAMGEARRALRAEYEAEVRAALLK